MSRRHTASERFHLEKVMEKIFDVAVGIVATMMFDGVTKPELGAFVIVLMFTCWYGALVHLRQGQST